MVLLQMHYNFLNLIIFFPTKQVHWDQAGHLAHLLKKKKITKIIKKDNQASLTKEIAIYLSSDITGIDLNMVAHYNSIRIKSLEIKG